MTIGPVYENNYKVYWAEEVSDISAPSLGTEIDSAVYLGRLLLKDGAALGVSQNRVTVTPIDSLFDAERGGSWGMQPQFTLYRDDVDEADGWEIIVPGTIGFLIITPFGEPEEGDSAMVLPAEMGVKQPADSAANTAQSFVVQFMVHAEPDLDAVVAT